ncbi:ABC transporter permease [Suicoccus acidiformans]|uniref:ABC transporter permease n=1 Tax=Suicoccus acidiformans TaxID=2036206 RepID=A0A347WJ35_9LACT|nr:MptD family putative ECF transporter S component [Suicoccus acidiformans]AXY25092.1 ABC transporter permease [Suicoccus acidiformans]
MSQSSRWKTQDFITTGIFAALYFIIISISLGLCVLVAPLLGLGYPFFYVPIIVALLGGAIFMLLALRVQKFGALTFLGCVFGVFNFISGLFPKSLLISLPIALLADYIACRSRYQSRKGLLVSYVVFAYNCVGPMVSMLADKDGFTQALVDMGRSMEYVETIYNQMSTGMTVGVLLAIFVCALIGGYFGQYLTRKHFVKAGIV